MKIVFTGGGTLGHIYPALALYDYIKLRDETIDFYWIGTNKKVEQQAVKSNNIKFYPINSGKLRRYFSLKNFFDFFKVIVGYFQAKKILKSIKPDLVFSKGGYVSVPVVYAAKRLKLKIVTHESDITLGLATRLNSKVSNIIFKGFPLNKEEKKDNRFIYSGNPLRSDLLFFKDLDLEKYDKSLSLGEDVNYNKQVMKAKSLIEEKFISEKPVILVVGGSLGALEINDLILANLESLLERFNIFHQMGSTTFKEVNKKGYIGVQNIGKELGYLYRKADLVISRCGANSLNEEIAFNKKILAIPLKTNASRGEQVLNAQYYKKLNLLEVYENRMNFVDSVNNLFDNEIVEKRIVEFNKHSFIDANKVIYETITNLI